MANIDTYLNLLFDIGLAVQKIVGHRSILAFVINLHTNLDITGLMELAKLIGNYVRERSPKSTLMPRWDMDLGWWTLIQVLRVSMRGETCIFRISHMKVIFSCSYPQGSYIPYPRMGTDLKDWSDVIVRLDQPFSQRTRFKTGHVLLLFIFSSLIVFSR
jgi:hypothetical protein